ncbi:MxaD family protein [Mycolicibacterium agri]|uniref:MxaD family protein n=1 Tax=Mycolicibacterium agri TaxID=36811 RepID=A0A2A7MNI9_MYCAG|nr:MxaD family protein [Mycolicibacterium agri]GFG54185.1 polyketide cyclase [Mycolicibacterium agri]
MLSDVTRWYPLQPADADFFESAPHVFTYQKRFAAPPAQVWEQLTSDASIAAWGPAVKELSWTSPRPFGVGTTREVVALGGARMRERYFRWEDGSRHSFACYESSLPLFNRFAEDYLIEPDGADTLFTWVVAIEPKRAAALAVKLLAPAAKAGFGRMPRDGQRYWANKTKRS